jgi:hypothetical protein
MPPAGYANVRFASRCSRSWRTRRTAVRPYGDVTDLQSLTPNRDYAFLELQTPGHNQTETNRDAAPPQSQSSIPSPP